MTQKKSIENVEILRKKLQRNIIDAAFFAGASSAHIGGALSSVDIVATLFSNFIKINPNNISDIDRDYFVLSKGHACLVYYAVLVELGFFTKEELKYFEKTDSFLLGHPVINKKFGIDFSTGSLGMGLSIGVGLAMSLKKKKIIDKNIYVLVGDGECNEGSIWEAVMCAHHYKLDNLNIIIDRNNLQQTGKSDDIMELGDLEKKFLSFGCDAQSVDGHNLNELNLALSNKPKSKPKAIIANTIKGKGLSFAENNNQFHHTILTKNLYDKAIDEINKT